MEDRYAINRKDVLTYLIMPQIFPRLRRLVGSGFNDVPYFMAVILATLRMIPASHPFLRQDMIGKYSVLNVLSVTAGNIRPGWKNIDKIVIFFLILAAIVMMLLQFVLFFVAIFTKSAFAQNVGWGGRDLPDFFSSPAPENDIAFQLLDYVFAIPGLFNDNVTIEPFHTGFHALLEFYSYGMVLIASIIIIYHAAAIVMETAQSGIPFGRRYNKVWAPVRLVLFFALLLPVAPHGMNLAQYILLYAAKLGSNVATNAWTVFDDVSSSEYLGSAENMVARPNQPNLNNIIAYIALARTCSWAEGRVNGRNIRPYIIYGNGNAADISGGLPAFSTIAQNVRGGTVTFRFGVRNTNLYAQETGSVFPFCGEMTMPLTDVSEPGSVYLQQAYMEMLACLWSGISGSAFQCYAYSFEDEARDYTTRYSTILPHSPFPNMDPYVGETQRLQYNILMNMGFDEALENAIEEQINNGDWNANPAVNRGWAGAGIWFNKVAQQNGALTTAVYNMPQIRRMPSVMEYVKQMRLADNANTPQPEWYTPILSSGRMINFPTPQDRDVAVILNRQFAFAQSNNTVSHFTNAQDAINATPITTTGNIIMDVMNLMLGTQGLFDMCRNTNVHPLAQLSSLGKGLVERSIALFGISVFGGAMTGLSSILGDPAVTKALSGLTSSVITFASIGLLLGFILFYVLPFIPFVYFFFAVMTWVKSIFEAMVAMPLWALAHLHIDGEGMPGQAAESGYFHILEIFIRPICIILGFLGGLIVFTAMVKVLHSIFFLVITNLSGHVIDPTATTGCFAPAGTATGNEDATEALFKRGVIDEFFYTVLYTIIVYMIGMACFKMVDLVPDNIMRWLGSGISSFGAMDGDPAQGLMKNVSTGAVIVGSKLRGSSSLLGFDIQGFRDP